MHVLDSSAIAVILRRLGGEAVGIIGGEATLSLAGYELGNIVWKECALKGLISHEEAVIRAGEIAKVLEIMRVGSIESSEDFAGVMRLSVELKITFYDASYLYLARKEGIALVTEDEELADRADRIDVRAMNVGGLLREKGESRP